VLTVIESRSLPVLAGLLDEEERGEFAAYSPPRPRAGTDPRLGWLSQGAVVAARIGKSGGVRVIYVARLVSGAVVLLRFMARVRETRSPTNVLRALAREMGHADE